MAPPTSTAPSSSVAGSLKLTPENDDKTAMRIFHILQDYLQPESSALLQGTVHAVFDVLPKGKPGSNEVWNFGQACLDIAEQMPYWHPSQLKLVGLVAELSYSTALGFTYDPEDGHPKEFTRLQQFGESLFDAMNSGTCRFSRSTRFPRRTCAARGVMLTRIRPGPGASLRVR